MASAAQREQQRRYIIERAYVGPEPLEDWHVAHESDRPGPIPARIIAAASRLGWTVQEMARTDWHLPKWEKIDGREAVYVAQPRRQYHLLVSWPGPSPKALKKAAKASGRTVGAVSLVYVDGVKFNLQVGLAERHAWAASDLSTNSIAKFLTENGVPRDVQ